MAVSLRMRNTTETPGQVKHRVKGEECSTWSFVHRWSGP